MEFDCIMKNPTLNQALDEYMNGPETNKYHGEKMQKNRQIESSEWYRYAKDIESSFYSAEGTRMPTSEELKRYFVNLC